MFFCKSLGFPNSGCWTLWRITCRNCESLSISKHLLAWRSGWYIRLHCVHLEFLFVQRLLFSVCIMYIHPYVSRGPIIDLMSHRPSKSWLQFWNKSSKHLNLTSSDLATNLMIKISITFKLINQKGYAR